MDKLIASYFSADCFRINLSVPMTGWWGWQFNGHVRIDMMLDDFDTTIGLLLVGYPAIKMYSETMDTEAGDHLNA